MLPALENSRRCETPRKAMTFGYLPHPQHYAIQCKLCGCARSNKSNFTGNIPRVCRYLSCIVIRVGSYQFDIFTAQHEADIRDNNRRSRVEARRRTTLAEIALSPVHIQFFVIVNILNCFSSSYLLLVQGSLKMFHTTLYPSCILLHAVLTLASPTPHKSTLNTSHQSFPERRGNSDSGVEWDNLTKALDYFGGRHESAAGGEGSTVSQRDSLDLATSSETDVKHKRRDEPPRTYTQKLKVLPALDIIPDGIYYAEVDIKGQDKPFSMIMDTGSSAFSVPGIKCGNQQGCQGDTKYSNSGIDQVGHRDHPGSLRHEADTFILTNAFPKAKSCYNKLWGHKGRGRLLYR